MGLISGLLLFPVMGPAKGLLFVLDQIKERVDTEMLDEGLIEEELVTLSLFHDLGELSDEDYLEHETKTLARLNAVRAYKESLELAAVGAGSDRG